jgi:hypothetical protein
MAGPLPIRRGVDRKSKTVLDPHEAFDAGEVVTEVEITTPPTAGSATVVQSGTRVRYVAPDEFVRNATFSWRMRVGGDWTLPAVVTLRVGRLPKRPGQAFPRRPLDEVAITRPAIVAAADTVTTAYRTPVVIDVLDNDTGVELSVVSASQPARGTTVLNEDGTITYTPAADFSGQDAFSYVITDGPQMAVGIVTVTVDPPEIAAEPDFATAIGNAPVLISPLTNDIGASLTVTAVGTPEHGTAAIADAGQRITYQAALGYTGVDSFSYTITDGAARTSVSTVQIEVLPPAIVIVGNNASTVTTTPVVIPVLANDVGVGLTVVDLPQPIDDDGAEIPTPSNGTAVISGGGTTVTYTANVGFTGLDGFVYTAQDAYGQRLDASVTVQVNAAPATIQAIDDAVSAVAGVTQTISPLTNDVGSSISIASVSAPSAGGQAIRTNGNSQILYTPLPSFTGNETFTYTITNGSATSSATITATVVAASLTIAPDNVTTRAGVPVTFSPLANDTGAGLRIVRINPPVAASCTVLNDDSTTGPPAGHDLFLIPYNKDSACHRPMGKDAREGIAGGTLNEINYDPENNDPDDIAAAMARIGRITFSTGAATFKYQHRVASTDGVRVVGWRGLRASSSGSGEGFGADGQSLVEVRMPAPGTVRDGATIAYPPSNLTGNPNAGDNSLVLFPKDGSATSTKAVLLNQFRYSMPDGEVPKAAEGQNAEARFVREVDLLGTDISGSGNGTGVGASELLPPGTYLRWFEISDPNHGPINHPLNLTGTRQNANKNDPSAPQVQDSAHLVGKKRVWPAKNVDLGPDGASAPDNNKGPFNCGQKFWIPPTTANKALRNDTTLCQNNRQRRLFDCWMYQGAYLVDGHGQSAPGDTSKGEMRIRIDDQIPSSVQSDLQGFLDRLLARGVIKPQGNPRRYGSETERHSDGLCYAGGGGPIDANSINNAYDAAPVSTATPLASYTLSSLTNGRWTDLIRHKKDRSGSGGGNNDADRYGQIQSIPLSSLNLRSPEGLLGEFRELVLDYNVTWAPEGYRFDWEVRRVDCKLCGGSAKTGILQSGKFFGLESVGDPFRKPGWNGTGNVKTKLPEGWSTRCSFGGDEFLGGQQRPGLAQTYLYDQARNVGAGGRKLKWFDPWPQNGNNYFQFQKGRKYRCTQRIRINSRTNEAAYTGSQSDGIWEQWIDGILVYRNTGIKFRGDCGGAYIYDADAKTDQNPPQSQYVSSMVAGLNDGDEYEPGAKTRRALIGSINLSQFYGGCACDGPTYDSHTRVGRIYLWTSVPQFFDAAGNLIQLADS